MKNIPVIILAFIFFISCTKEKSVEGTGNIQPQPGDKDFTSFAVTSTQFQQSHKFLKREVSFGVNNPHIKRVRVFSYDAANRVSKIELGTIDSSLADPQFTLSQTITINYDGSSILPVSVSNVRTFFPNITTNYYYTYNSQGLKIKDSVRVKNQAGDPADRVIKYEYNKGRVFVTPSFNGFPITNNSFDTLQLYDGNIGKLSSRFVKTTGDQMVVYTFTYDDHISPYNKLNIANSLYFESASLGIGYNVPIETHYMGVTYNNIASWTTGTYTATFKYIYDSDRYPVKKEMFLPNDPAPQVTTWFEYQ